MKLIAFNGSPRKDCNTHKLLSEAARGAESQNVPTQLIHLYDLQFSGCRSCYGCKTSAAKSKGICVLQDDLKELLAKIDGDTVLLFGSPVYFGDVTGVMRSFMERLLFPYQSPAYELSYFFKKPLRTGFIFTMSATEEKAEKNGYNDLYMRTTGPIKRIFGSCEPFIVYDTYHYIDYGRIFMPQGVEQRKTERLHKQFPLDCERAYQFGIRLVTESKN